jgi:hypothetical protein
VPWLGPNESRLEKVKVQNRKKETAGKDTGNQRDRWVSARSKLRYISASRVDQLALPCISSLTIQPPSVSKTPDDSKQEFETLHKRYPKIN